LKKIVIAAIITVLALWFLPAWAFIHEHGHALFALIAGVDPSGISFPEETRTHISVGLNLFQEALICQGGWIFEIGSVFTLLMFRKSPVMSGIAVGALIENAITIIAALIDPYGDFRHPYSWLGLPFALLLQTVAASSIILAIRGHYVRLQHSRKQSQTGRKLSTVAKSYR
jgi:hypothetical protein